MPWVVMALQDWDQFKPDSDNHFPWPIEVRVGPDEPTHWLAVFDDRGKAEEWANGKPVAEIQPVQQGGSTGGDQ